MGAERVCKVLALTFALLFLGSLAVNSYLGYLLYTCDQEESTNATDDTEAMARQYETCTPCRGCLTCLSNVTGEDNIALCDPRLSIERMLQCTEQLIYLYGGPNNNLPCYTACQRCEECLQNTVFNQPGSYQSTMWEILNPGLLLAPASVGITETSENFQSNNNGGRRRRNVEDDQCCATVTDILPYELDVVDDAGEVWHPVWVNIPWIEGEQKFQFYYDATCRTSESLCDAGLACTTADTIRTFLFTSMELFEPYEDLGYTLHFTVFGDERVKFINVDVAGYCRCVVR